VINELVGGLAWGSVAELWACRGRVFGLNAGSPVLLEEPAEMSLLRVPESHCREVERGGEWAGTGLS